MKNVYNKYERPWPIACEDSDFDLSYEWNANLQLRLNSNKTKQLLSEICYVYFALITSVLSFTN